VGKKDAVIKDLPKTHIAAYIKSVCLSMKHQHWAKNYAETMCVVVGRNLMLNMNVSVVSRVWKRRGNTIKQSVRLYQPK
jgi:hypothetical protein